MSASRSQVERPQKLAHGESSCRSGDPFVLLDVFRGVHFTDDIFDHLVISGLGSGGAGSSEGWVWVDEVVYLDGGQELFVFLLHKIKSQFISINYSFSNIYIRNFIIPS